MARAIRVIELWQSWILMKHRNMMLVAAFVAINLTLGKIAATLSLPIYLDTICTIVAATILPWRYSVLVGVGTALLAGLVIHPVYPFYAGNQFVIATLVYFAVQKGIFSSLWKSIALGALLAIVASMTAAPITALLFGGVTLSGVTGINALFMASGNTVWEAVIKGSLIIESLDKICACVIAYYVIRRLPTQTLTRA